MRQNSTLTALKLGLFVLFALLLICLGVIVATVPYEVKLSAQFRQEEAQVWYWQSESGSETKFETIRERKITSGEGIRLTEESSPLATVEIIGGSNAFAFLTQGTEWKLETATQRGTFWQHLQLSEDLTYEVVIQQTSGVVLYDFSESDPPLAELNLVLRLPDGDYKPRFNCFQASVGSVVEIPCGSERGVIPEPSLTLP